MTHHYEILKLQPQISRIFTEEKWKISKNLCQSVAKACLCSSKNGSQTDPQTVTEIQFPVEKV